MSPDKLFEQYGVIPLLRFVRDSANSAWRDQALVERFGRRAFDLAMRLGYIDRQRWQDKETGWIDLTFNGEAFLLVNASLRIEEAA